MLVQPNPGGDVVHSSLLYFIDRDGRERWVASPDTNKAVVTRWAQDIASVAASLSYAGHKATAGERAR